MIEIRGGRRATAATSFALLSLVLVAGCGSKSGTERDAGMDAGADSGSGETDAGRPSEDAGPMMFEDAGFDAGREGGDDAGPADAGEADAGEPDAGEPDAGEPDAGEPDAGPMDAGPMDAGRPDAGMADAGRPDAGRPDAGRPDAGRPDAGRPDAGMPDAGEPDAGMPDAGTPDAGPEDHSGTYGITIGAVTDPCGHRPFTGDPPTPLTLTRTGPGMYRITGASPWVTLNGTIDGSGNASFTGVGTVAGFPGVTCSFMGTIMGGTLSGTVSWGDALELPCSPPRADESIKFMITGAR